MATQLATFSSSELPPPNQPKQDGCVTTTWHPRRQLLIALNAVLVSDLWHHVGQRELRARLFPTNRPLIWWSGCSVANRRSSGAEIASHLQGRTGIMRFRPSMERTGPSLKTTTGRLQIAAR